MDTTDKSVWQNIIKENQELTEVAKKIKIKHKSNLEVNEIKDIIRLLSNIYKCSFEEILRGDLDNKLLPILGVKESKKESIKNSKEEMVEFKPTKKTILPEKLKTRWKQLLTTVVITVGIGAVMIGVVNPTWDDYKDSRNALNNISIVSSQIENGENVKGTSIVDQCMELRGHTAEGIPIYKLNIDLLAQKIEYLCSLNKELFDIYMSNVYFDLDTARLENMDNLLKKLQEDFSLDDNYKNIYNKIKEYDTYLDYIMSLGIINEDRSDYNRIKFSVGKYKVYKEQHPNLPFGAFELLNPEEQGHIYTLIYEYEKYKNSQNYNYGDEIQELTEIKISDELGGRPSGS